MPMELGLWRVDGQPMRLAHTGMPLEKTLEDLLERDPDILGEPLLIIGRQVPTAYGKVIDLLAIDGDGRLHVIELKRDKTLRDATAQALDYGSWFQNLTHDRVLELFANHQPDISFEQAFADRFGAAPPEEINTSHVLTIVATDVDPATERILAYLANYGVPINVAMSGTSATATAPLADTPIRVNGPAPGHVAIDFNNFRGTRTPEQGAAVALRLATLPAEGPTSVVFEDHTQLAW